MNKTLVSTKKLILAKIDQLKHFFLKKRPEEIQETKAPYPYNLADECPDKCGCKEGECESDRIFFSELYMYYAYKEKMFQVMAEKKKQQELEDLMKSEEQREEQNEKQSENESENEKQNENENEED